MADFTLAGFLASAATGGLLGSVVQQMVEGRREKARMTTEDRRRGEDRQHVLDDARTERREKRYVALLSELIRFDRIIVQCIDITNFYAERRDKKEAAQENETAEFADVSDVIQLAELAGKLYEDTRNAQQAASEAYFAAYVVASDQVREAGRHLVDYPLALYIEDLTRPGRRLMIDEPMPRRGTHKEFAEQTAERLEAGAS